MEEELDDLRGRPPARNVEQALAEAIAAPEATAGLVYAPQRIDIARSHGCNGVAGVRVNLLLGGVLKFIRMEGLEGRPPTLGRAVQRGARVVRECLDERVGIKIALSLLNERVWCRNYQWGRGEGAASH